MSTPQAKRRKLGSAAALSKPFKSPMRTPLRKSEESSALTPGQTPAPAAEKVDLNSETKASLIETAASKAQVQHAPRSSLNTPIPTTASRTIPMLSSPGSPRVQLPEIKLLQREKTALLSQLASVRSALDTSTQALKITRSTRDSELEQLIEVWKAASRAMAEELFATAKDRVNGMGGLGAWKEKERGRREGWGGEEGEGYGCDQNEIRGEEGQEGTGMLRAEREGEGDFDSREEGVREAWEESGNDDEVSSTSIVKSNRKLTLGSKAFTIDMMLRSLNIELGLIGYDKDLQRWGD